MLAATCGLGGGCLSLSPAAAEPTERFIRSRNFSGTYAFVDVATNLRSGGADHSAGPHATLVPLGRLQPNSALLVTHRPGMLAFTYRQRSGTIATRFYDPDVAPAAWHGNQLVFGWISKVLPTSVLSGDSSIGLLSGRRLVLTSSSSESGFYLVVPLHVKNTTVATLAPAPQEDAGLRRAFEEALELHRRALGGDAEAQIKMSRTFLAGERDFSAADEG